MVNFFKLNKLRADSVRIAPVLTESQNRIHRRNWEAHSGHGETAVASFLVTYIHETVEKRFRLTKMKI